MAEREGIKTGAVAWVQENFDVRAGFGKKEESPEKIKGIVEGHKKDFKEEVQKAVEKVVRRFDPSHKDAVEEAQKALDARAGVETAKDGED